MSQNRPNSFTSYAIAVLIVGCTAKTPESIGASSGGTPGSMNGEGGVSGNSKIAPQGGADSSIGEAGETSTLAGGDAGGDGGDGTDSDASKGGMSAGGATSTGGSSVASTGGAAAGGPATGATGGMAECPESGNSCLAVIDIAANGTSNCALLSDGTVKCWGANNEGQLGDNTTTNSSFPVPVQGLTGATALITGGSYNCALLVGGTVECWGDNSYNELGNGTGENSSIPVAVKGLIGVKAIVAGIGFNNCALLTNGTVECWGWSGSTPIAIPGLSGATALIAGGTSVSTSTCALLMDGTVECWGTGSATPVAVIGLGGATALVAGGDGTYNCALLTDGTVECWGNNEFGELGNDTTTSSSTPVVVKNLSSATALVAGDRAQYQGTSYTCALLVNGTVQCWGGDAFGSLGDGSIASSFVPVTVKGLSGATAIVSRGGSSCALVASGAAECWGFDGNGQLGNGTTTDLSIGNPSTPVAVTGVSAAARVVAGGSYNCAILPGGNVKCWGDNTYGQLGNGTTTNSPTPVTVLW